METAVQQRTRPMCPVAATDRPFPSLQLPPAQQEPGKQTSGAPRLLWQCEAQVMKAKLPSIILANAEVLAADACPHHSPQPTFCHHSMCLGKPLLRGL